MRKILFRGRDYEGKWHKGSLIVVNAPKYKDIEPCKAYVIREQNFAGEEHEVNPETIGQLVSGATEIYPDIWEGDIIEDKDGYRMVVEFDPYRHAFFAVMHRRTIAGYESIDEQYLDFMFKNVGAKVVGNIHDNPELINKPFAQPHEKAQTN